MSFSVLITIVKFGRDFLPFGIVVLAIYGGLITEAIVLYIFADRKLINTWDFLDIAAPSVMIAQKSGTLG